MKFKIIFVIISFFLIIYDFYNMAYILIALVNIYYFYFFYKKSIFFYKVPYYNKALKGVYVKFVGKVEKHNKLKTPIYHNECEYYKFKIKALWEVKAPKPQKGYITESKPLGNGYSDKNILISDGSKKVFVTSKIPDGKMAKLEINEEVIDSKSSLKGYKKNKKFQIYRYFHKYLKAGDLITVYGVLLKENDKFIISNTNNEKLPFMMFLGNKTNFKDFYYLELIEKSITVLIIITLYLLGLPNSYNQYTLIMFLLIFLIVSPITGFVKIIKKVHSESRWTIY